MPGVYAGDYLWHIDSESLVTVEPDPEMLFMIYHNIFEGMLLENVTIEEEWFNLAGEIATVPDLDLLLQEYGDQLLEQAIALNNTKFYLDQAVANIGEFDFESARSSFFKGLSALQASNRSIPILEETTIRLGERLRANPEILLQDLEDLGFYIDDYQSFVQVLVDYLGGEPLSEDDIELLKETLAGVIDEGYLESIGDIVDPKVLVRTKLTLNVTPNSVLVGDYLQIDGRLTSSVGPLESKKIAISVGGEERIVSTGPDGLFEVQIQVPYNYKESTVVQCFYWPKGNDVSVYAPSTAFQEIELIYYVPEIKSEYGEALPGLNWNVSGSLTYDGHGLEGFTVGASLLGMVRSSVTDESGLFEISVPVDPGTPVGAFTASVYSASNLEYSGVVKTFPVQVVKMPLMLQVKDSSLIFSGGFATLDIWVESNGIPLDRARIRVTDEYVSTAYTVNGSSSVSLYSDLFRSTGDFPYTVSVTPREPWIESASISGTFPVYSSFLVIGYFVVLGSLAYNDYVRGKPQMDYPEIKSNIRSVEMPVKPIASKPGSFSWLYQSVLSFVESITGVVIRPSDTIREYVGRITNRLSEGIRRVFEELSMLYERWLYDRPFKVDVERVKVLVQQVKEQKDEE